MPNPQPQRKPYPRRGKTYAARCVLCKGTGEVISYVPGKGNVYTRCPEKCLPEHIDRK